MNILILTGRFGMGHIKCAEALEEKIMSEHPDSKVFTIDVIDYIFPHLSSMIYKSFSLLVTRLPGMYNLCNKSAARYGGVPLKRTIARKIEKLIEYVSPDLVVANLPVCSKYFSAYKDFSGCKIPLYTYITDITVHEEWLADNTDLYFVGDNSTRQALISKGVPEKKIIISGIPVKSCFNAEAEYVCERDKNHAEGFEDSDCTGNILIMGGGLGLIPGGTHLLKYINDHLDLHATLIAGQNKKLARKVSRMFPNINVVGYTDKVYEYMKEADLVVTKPGGITTFEAIASQTPLYVINPFLEQEMGNAYFIESSNIGRIIRNCSSEAAIGDDLAGFMSRNGLLHKMKCNMRRISDSLSCGDPIYYYNLNLNHSMTGGKQNG